MENIVLCILLIAWGVLPFILCARIESIKKNPRTIYGNLYVRKRHINGGPNPCHHNIETIEPIEIPGIGSALYISK